MKISALWIVKNEAENLARTMESVAQAVDELLVVDTGSTDGTPELAKKLGARTDFFEWRGDFSAARNYALSKAEGDVVIFLDADEWFSPALTKKDRMVMESYFVKNPRLDALQITIRNLDESGAVATTASVDRILRKRANLLFKNKIHERYARKGGADLIRENVNHWILLHSGYVESVADGKGARNIEMLETAVAASKSQDERYISHVYLVREYRNTGNLENAAAHLRVVLDDPAALRRLCGEYAAGAIAFFYSMIEVSAKTRDRFSRREISDKLVTLFERSFQGYPGVTTFRLYFQSLFDPKEDRLLSELDGAVAKARGMKPDDPIIYREAEAWLYGCAASAACRRGNNIKALDYAVESFQVSANQNPASLYALLMCIRDQSPQDVVLFLNGLFDVNNPDSLRFLADGTRIASLKDVHGFYLKKLIDTNAASLDDYFSLLLLHGKYEGIAETAREMYSESAAGCIGFYLFLAAVCSGDERIYAQNAEFLAPYAHLLEAYFSEKALESFSLDDLSAYSRAYGLVAFFTGDIERADRLAGIFDGLTHFLTQTKLNYCFHSGFYERVLSSDSPNVREEIDIQCVVIGSMLMLKQYEAALERVRAFLNKGVSNQSLLNLLLVVAECDQIAASLNARQLYDKHVAHQDAVTDLRDVVNTGYAVDDVGREELSALKTMSIQEYYQMIQSEDAARAVDNALLELCEKAGAVYEQKNMYGMAQRCYRLTVGFAHNKEVSRANLARVIRAIGNETLADELEALK